MANTFMRILIFVCKTVRNALDYDTTAYSLAVEVPRSMGMYSQHLYMGPLSWCVHSWQACLVKGNVTLLLTGSIQKIRRKRSVVSTTPGGFIHKT